MATTPQENFERGPEKVRTGMMALLTERFPDYAHLLEWSPDGKTASGSKLGAKGSLELDGNGPTTLSVTYRIPYLVSLVYSEQQAAEALQALIKELKSRVP